MSGSDDIIARTLGLPWNIQVAIASGYAAYLFAYKGTRKHHQTIDVAFSTLAFSAVATASLWLLNIPKRPVRAGVEAFFITIITALLWRKLEAPIIGAIVRLFNISWSNDDPSALDTLAADSKNRVTQVAVALNDGTWLRCDDTKLFEALPFGPYTLGQAGDIALYLTHERKPNDVDARELKTVAGAYGTRITYVPATNVKQITIRYANKSNRFLQAVALLRSWSQGPPWVKRKPQVLAESTLVGSSQEPPDQPLSVAEKISQ